MWVCSKSSSCILPWILFQDPETLTDASTIHWSFVLLHADINSSNPGHWERPDDVDSSITIASAWTKQFQYQDLMLLMTFLQRLWLLIDILGQGHHLTSKRSFLSSRVPDEYQERSCSSNFETLVLIQTCIANWKGL